MAEWVDRKSQVRTSMGLTTVKEEQSINQAMAEETLRAERKRRKREELLQCTSYSLSEGVANLMDRYFLDAIIGLLPGVGDVLSSVFMMPQLYLCMFKIRSLPLTLAVTLNIVIDACLGLIPFWIGNICDIFHRAYIKNMKLITGFVQDDKEIIEEVNRKATKSAILILIFIGIIYLLIKAISSLVDWISSLF